MSRLIPWASWRKRQPYTHRQVERRALVKPGARALPDGCHDTHRLLGVAATEIRGELRATLNRPNPLRPATSKEQRCTTD